MPLPPVLAALLALAPARAATDEDPTPFGERVDAAMGGASSCAEMLLDVHQTTSVGQRHSTTTHVQLRARLDHDSWTPLETLVEDLGNEELVLTDDDGSPFVLPLMGRSPKADGSHADASNADAMVDELLHRVHTEWLEPQPGGAMRLRRVYREKGHRDGTVTRNQLVADFAPDQTLTHIKLTMDLPKRVGPMVRVRGLVLEMDLAADGQLERETLDIFVRGLGIPARIQRRLAASAHRPCGG